MPNKSKTQDKIIKIKSHIDIKLLTNKMTPTYRGDRMTIYSMQNNMQKYNVEIF